LLTIFLELHDIHSIFQKIVFGDSQFCNLFTIKHFWRFKKSLNGGEKKSIARTIGLVTAKFNFEMAKRGFWQE
jgi:hypothetical protein